MRLLLLHGWGFGADLWEGVRALLPDHPAVAWDRGYFGLPTATPVAAPFLAVGHSLGALLLLAAPPPGCAGVVAINGFRRFAGADAVAPRVVARMRHRFVGEPRAVLDGFRARCGAGPAAAMPVAARLADDLATLATLDATDRPPPIAALHGGADPIVVPAMRADGRTVPDGGHLLPVTHPAACAALIRAVGGWA